ncbi:hypothetical protein D9M68_950890 [compost metagenome]
MQCLVNRLGFGGSLLAEQLSFTILIQTRNVIATEGRRPTGAVINHEQDIWQASGHIGALPENVDVFSLDRWPDHPEQHRRANSSHQIL